MNFLSTETLISLFSLSEIQSFNTNLPSSHSLNKCRLPHTSILQRNEKSNLSECLINESMNYQDETTGGDGLWPSELKSRVLFSMATLFSLTWEPTHHRCHLCGACAPLISQATFRTGITWWNPTSFQSDSNQYSSFNKHPTNSLLSYITVTNTPRWTIS